MNESTDGKVRENRLRRWAARHGLALHKSRAKRLSIDDFGEYRLVDHIHNWIVAGEKFDWSLDDVEEYLTEADQRLLAERS